MGGTINCFKRKIKKQPITSAGYFTHKKINGICLSCVFSGKKFFNGRKKESFEKTW